MLSSFQIVFSIQSEKRWKWYFSVFYLSYYLLQVTSYISMHVNLACAFYYWHTHFVNKRDGLYVSLDYIILSDVNIDISSFEWHFVQYLPDKFQPIWYMFPFDIFYFTIYFWAFISTRVGESSVYLYLFQIYIEYVIYVRYIPSMMNGDTYIKFNTDSTGI